jgi:hypothetical protein
MMDYAWDAWKAVISAVSRRRQKACLMGLSIRRSLKEWLGREIWRGNETP